MNLQSGTFYWPTTFPDPPSYPVLEEDIDCDVLIIGAGTSGAQCAYFLSDTDLDVVVVEKRKAGHGSTAVNTALIQYLGEKMFFELINSFGEMHAVRHLKLCEQAIRDLADAAQKLPFDCEFVTRDSLYYASSPEDVSKLEKEYAALKKHGFAVEWWTEQKIARHYPFRKPAALLTKEDGEVNPYKLTLGLLEYAKHRGVAIYEQTEINGKKLEKDQAMFYTNTGAVIHAKSVIIAAGYETLNFKKDPNAVLSSTYAVVTNQVDDFSSWHNRTLIWETARPYIYMRTTADNRIIIGGLDEDTAYADERDAKLIHKRDQLIAEFQQRFPTIPVRAEFYLGAYYAGTHDGLPIIGVYDEYPNCYFVYAYGDNGAVYSMALAKCLRDWIAAGKSDNAQLYLPDRPLVSSFSS
ncbi:MULTISPECIES: NAD(P)/FAD-dependent oxidoreductase [Geobacillus]|uniref:FAD-dependent oxidoreductase n=1 Tax=Geobacillus thermocatenulatus TaxID=33938 RepID=A0A226Q9W8_9BACL|nr:MULTISPECIES: FAD-dependent oxidoreductase [Geobacillus]ASS98433.1 FAD-dependent oxidoreductase [Geobacillus thermocatenulatus]KLR74138.1 FAD-dependent oxidoreductase [Geobacillus sp. T6]OXB89185.1 FAD-dependent oxidoreductase [Geobacillus thermocatenulatus]